jgi:hypothetical protein
MVVFPVNLFLVESDLSPVKENIDKFIDGLTKWQPTIKEKKLISPPMITVEGKDYEQAFAQANQLYLMNSWSDGLPLLPPTNERVKWILKGSDLSPDTKIGKIQPRGGIATVETLAVALAMAGGRPEYLPVLIATVEAIVNPVFMHESWQATSASIFPAVVVNGTIGKQIRLNSGFGLVGPDPAHPAGGCIGRALRLIQQNVGGAVPGVGTMAQYGGMRYTNAVFAEDEAGLPKGWEPFNVEYLGYPKGTNTVAVYTVSGIANIQRRGIGKETLEEEAEASFRRIAGYMRAPNLHINYGYFEGGPGILLISSVIAEQLDSQGWTKEKLKKHLWELSKIPGIELERFGWTKLQLTDRGLLETLKQDPWPVTSKAGNIMIIVAGGHHPTHVYWMQAAQTPKAVSARIKLPAKWDELIKQAETDLGPLPDM